MSHPYKQFENTTLWEVIKTGIDDLIENNDIEEKTREECIVGYLCLGQIIEKLSAQKKHIAKQ